MIRDVVVQRRLAHVQEENLCLDTANDLLGTHTPGALKPACQLRGAQLVSVQILRFADPIGEEHKRLARSERHLPIPVADFGNHSQEQVGLVELAHGIATNGPSIRTKHLGLAENQAEASTTWPESSEFPGQNSRNLHVPRQGPAGIPLAS
jgi:hypothetical protein